MSIVLLGSTSGSCTLQEQAVAGTTTLTLPITSGTVAINGPAFSAYQSATQTLTGTVTTKIQCQTEEFDTANCYDNTTNYRFTPNVAGYYQFNAAWTANTNPANLNITFYKNGVVEKRGQNIQANAATVTVSALIYLNGTTDYVELYVFSSTTQAGFLGVTGVYFQGAMVRGA